LAPKIADELRQSLPCNTRYCSQGVAVAVLCVPSPVPNPPPPIVGVADEVVPEVLAPKPVRVVVAPPNPPNEPVPPVELPKPPKVLGMVEFAGFGVVEVVPPKENPPPPPVEGVVFAPKMLVVEDVVEGAPKVGVVVDGADVVEDPKDGVVVVVEVGAPKPVKGVEGLAPKGVVVPEQRKRDGFE
jgi:hypothetical protein